MYVSNLFNLLVWSLLLTLSSCTDPDCKNILYDLEVNLSMIPARATYSLQDTVTMTINAPVEIFNRFTNEFERIKLFDVNYQFYIFRVDSIISEEELTRDNTYDNIRIVGKSPDIRTDFVPGIIYIEPTLQGDTVFTSNVSFLFEKPGVYYMQCNGFNDEEFFFSGETIVDNILLVDGCKKVRVDIFNSVNGGANNNLDILCDIRPILCSAINKPEDRTEYFDRRAGYIFKVVD